ncbi:MAG TPA: hypothetical protein VIR60_06980 [Gammaproteobacteria bacterium]
MSTLSNTAPVPDTAIVAHGHAVRLRFWARHRESRELLQYGDDLWYTHGGFGGVFPRVEQALDGLRCGERAVVELEPQDGYGRRDPALFIVQSLDSLPDEDLVPGAVLFGELADGREHPFIVVRVEADQVLLDGNHPWAGLPLEFTFEVLEIRTPAATGAASN